MRIAILLMSALLLLAGCHKKFDDQYAETEKQLQAEAKQLDKDMAKAEKQELGAPEKKNAPIR